MAASDVRTVDIVEPTKSGAGFNVNRKDEPSHEFDRSLLHALQSARRGDFSVRLAGDQDGVNGRIADAFNDIVSAAEEMAHQLEFVGQRVGRDGETQHRVKYALSGGAWGRMESTVNTLIDDLLWPTIAVTDSIAAVARGDLLRTVRLDVGGRPLRGEFLRLATIVNTMIEQLSVFTSEVTRVAREVGTDGKLGGQAQVRAVTGVWRDLTESVNSMASNLTAQVRNIAEVTIAVANGDLSKKITVDVRGEILQLKEAINTMVDQLRSFASEVTRVAREVGTDGKLGGQAIVPGVAGTWKDLTDSVNAMCGSLTDQVRNIAEVTTAVARGDLSRKITVDVRGEIRELKNTINTMVDQLNAFASEVTRVAREVGTEGRLGGEARVDGVAGTWKDLTDSVNDMARNLTAQVRNIAEVATAVARGDLSKKITVNVSGEILKLKETVNTMVDQLNAFAGEVTRVAHEVGTEGRLGGQAAVPGVDGTWKDLTGNVNQLAANLTTQVRAIAEVATAVTKGDMTRSIEVEARGEVAELKDDINTMILNLRQTTETNTEQAWLNTNLARFGNMLQGQRDLVTIGRMLLSELAPLVGAQSGVIYIVEERAGLNLLAAYADTGGEAGRPVRLMTGEGLIGQCAADARLLLITDVPTDGVLISSGLVRAAPRNLVILPISFEGKVKAVIELASVGSFTPLHISFLEQLTASIGVVLNSIEATTRTEDLLKQTQMLATELQAQQQELQQRVADRTAQLAETNASLERRVEERTREREAALAQVHEMQKLESLGQLTGGVAHDFNNLLATIIGNLEMMAAVLPKNGSAKRYTEAALSAATRGSRLTQHLLAFSRRQEIRPQTVDINDILSETLLLCQQTTGEGIEIESRLQPDTWLCHIDPAQFEAAILNLTVNARDAMNRSGVLTITSENITLEDGFAADLPPGDYVVVSVSDTGYGMSEDVLLRVFEPFYTTKDIGKGTGLGLSQVYGFAKQSGGSAQIESEVGRGTTVRIFIPRCDRPLMVEPVVVEPVALAEPEPSGQANASILVVEDDANVREMVVNMLSNFGYRTSVARNGPEALELLQNCDAVDLLLSDVVMPAGMSGTELARAAQRLRPELKILLTSGYTGVEPEPEVTGQFPFIAKPYRAEALGQKLREVLAPSPVAQIAADEISGNRLLLIDDERDFGELVKTVAQSCGFEVVITDDPRSFAITARSWNPTVIMLDLKIPGTDGIQLLRSLAADQCTADIVITSGSDQKVLDAAMQLGHGRGLKMRSMLPKPIRVDQLREMLLGFRRLPRQSLVSDLADAIASEQLFLEYQPKFDCNLKRFIGVEALVRWRDPGSGIIMPGAFIPVAEESNMIHRLTDWVVRAAARQAALWHADGRSLELAINISAHDIDDLELPERLAQHCTTAGIAPDRIILELTETGAMRQAVQMMDVLTRLRLKGFRLSIDDFGTGYSSLAQLQQLPFSELKIDQSFVRRLLENRDCRAIAESTVELARRLGLKCVAEGVEDAPTLNALIEMGCLVVQGYHLSRPLPADRIARVLADRDLPKLIASPSVN